MILYSSRTSGEGHRTSRLWQVHPGCCGESLRRADKNSQTINSCSDNYLSWRVTFCLSNERWWQHSNLPVMSQYYVSHSSEFKGGILSLEVKTVPLVLFFVVSPWYNIGLGYHWEGLFASYIIGKLEISRFQIQLIAISNFQRKCWSFNLSCLCGHTHRLVFSSSISLHLFGVSAEQDILDTTALSRWFVT